MMPFFANEAVKWPKLGHLELASKGRGSIKLDQFIGWKRSVLEGGQAIICWIVAQLILTAYPNILVTQTDPAYHPFDQI